MRAFDKHMQQWFKQLHAGAYRSEGHMNSTRERKMLERWYTTSWHNYANHHSSRYEQWKRLEDIRNPPGYWRDKRIAEEIAVRELITRIDTVMGRGSYGNGS